ncbi:LCP family protein [Haloechinothrix sp. LS1_15]|uniref:LCP family protein n=1 Tax=Haloechinothrix sp. LS1_15 TaxID=2652248 RepID=UPI0029451590|nr:LCP family protein [Haloechinothrix sp. LS1_15]MDV6010965.1 LytR family transcriptional regulator [Haloechinothrix sp. LS1_15]
MDDRPRSRRPSRPWLNQELETTPAIPRVHGSPSSRGGGSGGRSGRDRRGGPALRSAKVALALVSLLVFGVTGYAWASVQGLGQGMTMADVIRDGGDGGMDGPRDILLVGLGDRRDAQGEVLPAELRQELNIGRDAGLGRADTIMLIRIPEDGDGAVGFSIPRDSYVDIPGFGEHKINSAYARGKAAERKRLEHEEGVTDQSELEVLSNQAGARTLIESVEALTGITINNYASLNMFGFYELTNAIGGVEVCLNNAVQEHNSGADFDAGVQTVSGVDALAFVRQRHGLPRGDLDRVVRQQAFLAGLARQMISAGTLANPGKLNDLIDAVQGAIVLDQDWEIMDFAQQVSGISGGNIEFHTVPVLSAALDTADGAAVQLDEHQVRQFIAEHSGEGLPDPEGGDHGQQDPQDPQANAGITVNVMNTTTTPGLASEVSEALVQQGFTQGMVSNAARRDDTVVRHASGDEELGQRVADALGAPARVEPDPNLAAGHVTVLIGEDYAAADRPGRVDAGGSSPAGQQPGQQPDLPGDDQPGAPMPGDDVSGEQAEDAPTDRREEPITADGIPCVN